MDTDVFQFFAGLVLAAIAVFFVPFIHLPFNAAAQDRAVCGSLYRVAPGDTLREIALRAYGTGDYQAIFEANRDTMTSVSRIEVGDELLIPCLDGARPRVRATALWALAAHGEPDARLKLEALHRSETAPANLQNSVAWAIARLEEEDAGR